MPGGRPQRLVSTVATPIMITAPVMASSPSASSRALGAQHQQRHAAHAEQPGHDLDRSDLGAQQGHRQDHHHDRASAS